VADCRRSPAATGSRLSDFSSYDIAEWRLHRSAERHGSTEEAIRHALLFSLVNALISDDDPPRLLVIGPDDAGNLLEVVALLLADGPPLVIHAMRLRRSFWRLLEP
jgi:hypothetical protein